MLKIYNIYQKYASNYQYLSQMFIFDYPLVYIKRHLISQRKSVNVLDIFH